MSRYSGVIRSQIHSICKKILYSTRPATQEKQITNQKEQCGGKIKGKRGAYNYAKSWRRVLQPSLSKCENSKKSAPLGLHSALNSFAMVLSVHKAGAPRQTLSPSTVPPPFFYVFKGRPLSY
jgi:hypothetical protein